MSEAELYSILHEYLALSTPNKLNEPAREAYKELIKYISYLQKENQKQNKAIAKAINLIKKSIEQQLENDYLMDRAHLMNYNCKLLDILKEVE